MKVVVAYTSCWLILAFALHVRLAEQAHAVVTFDWATVGDVGNEPDTLAMTKGVTADGTTGYGSVGYTYRISKTHVTNSQYAEFLNAVDPDGTNSLALYDDRMEVWYNPVSFEPGPAYTGGINFDQAASAGSKYSVKSGQANYPATWINWDSGARFVNWLHNGQGSGDTENGVYDMSIPRSTIAGPLPRQAGATVFIPSEDEFYKAAYYDPSKDGTGGYWEYGIQSNTAPISGGPPGGVTTANYATAAGMSGSNGDIYWQNGSTFDQSLDYLTDVGAYTTATSYYGLLDADGLIYQWTEGVKVLSATGADFPAYRGGSWYDSSARSGAAFRALYSFRDVPSYAWFGLRVASLPEMGLPGDYNDDGVVNLADYTVWRDNLGASDSVLNGNGDGANGVDVGADYLRWKNNFGAMAELENANVSKVIPEPGSATLLVFLVVAACNLPRQNRMSSRQGQFWTRLLPY